MRSSLLLCALGLLAACNNGHDSSSSDTDDSQRDEGGAGNVDADRDGWYSTNDCDDKNGRVNPGAFEVCDEIDNNCVDGIDEGVTKLFYPDVDADTYGAGTAVEACTAPSGYADNADDCDDTTAAANPGGTEVCDEIDNNCVDGVDEGLTTPFYRDRDNDGYGAGAAVDLCTLSQEYVENADDCDDRTRHVNPSATEICDSIDNDCDGDIDDDDPDVEGGTKYWQDCDGDGDGYWRWSTVACEKPGGYSDNPWDRYDCF